MHERGTEALNAARGPAYVTFSRTTKAVACIMEKYCNMLNEFTSTKSGTTYVSQYCARKLEY